MSRTNPRLRPPLPLPPLPQSRRPRRIPPLLRSRRGPPRLLPRLPLFFVSVDSRGGGVHNGSPDQEWRGGCLGVLR